MAIEIGSARLAEATYMKGPSHTSQHYTSRSGMTTAGSTRIKKSISSDQQLSQGFALTTIWFARPVRTVVAILPVICKLPVVVCEMSAKEAVKLTAGAGAI